jgi:hypothetical protein
MSALPTLDPPKQSQKSIDTSVLRQTHRLGENLLKTPKSSPRTRHRSASKEASPMQIKSNPAYTHRRQGLEAVTKLVTYSTLSVFGIVTLVNSIGYNWSQHSKLQHLETELQDAKLRTKKINTNFNRSFDPQAQKSVMQENSYKVAPDRLQIFLVTPGANRPVSNQRSK